MPKRPRSHIIEEISRIRLRDLFIQHGWMVWDLYPDPGEDLLVRIFVNGNATHYSFFIQAKSTDHIDRYMDKEGSYLSYPIDVDHLQHWEQFWEPVILTVLDTKSDITYWEIIQNFLANGHIDGSRRKKITVKIPLQNVLNEHSLDQIFEHTKERFDRFDLAHEGTEALVKKLEDILGTKIDFQAGDQALVINYPSGEAEWSLFGELAIKFSDLANQAGYSDEELGDFYTAMVMQLSIQIGLTTEEITEDGQVLLYRKGTLLESFASIREFEYKYDRNRLLGIATKKAVVSLKQS